MLNKKVYLLLAGAVVPVYAYAATPPATPPATMSDAEAEAAFQAAQKAYQNTRQNVTNPPTGKQVDKQVELQDAPQVVVYSDAAREIVPGTDRPANMAIENIRVVVDVENASLRDIMHKVVTQAAKYTGPWQVKWRLKPENAALLDERVNLTAEARFGDFIDLLTERVKNMSGTQLFVTTFNESRIIMVADTYY